MEAENSHSKAALSRAGREKGLPYDRLVVPDYPEPFSRR